MSFFMYTKHSTQDTNGIVLLLTRKGIVQSVPLHWEDGEDDRKWSEVKVRKQHPKPQPIPLHVFSLNLNEPIRLEIGMDPSHTGVLIETYFNGVLVLDIDSSYLEEENEDLSQQELVEYLQEIARTLRFS